jgi:predicted lipoprotein with Yx(FWY)xxD motif
VLNFELEDDLVARRRRPEWMWVALEGDRLLARVAWWSRSDDGSPSDLDILDVDNGDAEIDSEELCFTLLETATAEVIPKGSRRPDYGRFIAADWRDQPETSKPVEVRMAAVESAGIGEQVTYAGHPLYLFETSPAEITGEGWDEPDIPPWHGLWYLVSPSGNALAWPGTLKEHNSTVLAALENTLAGWEAFPLYSYSGDTSSTSACTGSCSVAWPPVLTSGDPAQMNSLSSSKVGTIKLSDGELQLTYAGKPLYFYSNEGVTKGANGFETTGSGNAVKAPSPATGTFSFATP